MLTDEPNLLPAVFSDLERFARRWGDASNTDERYQLRTAASFDQLRDLHASILPRLEAIFDHLDKTPYDEDLRPEEQRLYQLALFAAEAASAVEVFHQPDVPLRTSAHVIRAKWSDEI